MVGHGPRSNPGAFFIFPPGSLRNVLAKAEKISIFVRYSDYMFQAVINIESGMYADYFRYIFPPVKPGGDCVISTSHPTGALIVALASASDTPVSVSGEHLVNVDIPWSKNATSSIENHFVYFDKGATARINLALKAEFDLEFTGYVRKGEACGMRKMDIIEAFIFTRNLAPENYDALHKRAYRKSVDSQERLKKRLLRKAYYIDERIDFKGLTPEK